MDILQNAGLVVIGGALKSAVDLVLRWRQASAEAKVIETKAESDEGANERESVGFVVRVLKEQVEALKRDVIDARREAQEMHAATRSLRDEHDDCRKSVAELEIRIMRKDAAIEELEKTVKEQGTQIAELLAMVLPNRGA